MAIIIDIFAVVPSVVDGGVSISDAFGGPGQYTGSIGGPGIAGGNIVAAISSPFVNLTVNGQLQGLLTGFTIVKIAAEVNNGVSPADIGLGDAIQVVAGTVTVTAAILAVTAGAAVSVPLVSLLGLTAAIGQLTANQNGFTIGRVAASVNTIFNDAINYVIPRRDPLVLDLDGDGLELIAANGSVLFDHNADGIKTGTDWAAPNDGLLVRDLNGNGSIDSGRELFGIDTLKANNTFATQGFDALKDLDSNLDGFITSADTAFAELQVWQDLNQDGISQAGELKTLSQWGITSISANGSATGPQAGQVLNGNRVDLSDGFTQNSKNATFLIATCAGIH